MKRGIYGDGKGNYKCIKREEGLTFKSVRKGDRKIRKMG